MSRASEGAQEARDRSGNRLRLEQRVRAVRLQRNSASIAAASCTRISFMGTSPPRRWTGRSRSRTRGNCSAAPLMISGLSVSITTSSIDRSQQRAEDPVEERSSRKTPIVLAWHPLALVPHRNKRHQSCGHQSPPRVTTGGYQKSLDRAAPRGDSISLCVSLSFFPFPPEYSMRCCGVMRLLSSVVRLRARG